MRDSGGMRSALALGFLVAWGASGVGAASIEEAKEQARKEYQRMADAFLASDWSELAEALKMPAGQLRLLTPGQRADVAYVRKTAAECRPAWWKAAKSTTRRSFRVTLWGRPMAVVFTPAEKSNVNVQTTQGRRTIAVSWNPSPLDSTAPAGGEMAAHGCTAGDLADLTVWQTLANAQLMTSMPLKTLSAFYNRDKEAFQRYQLFRNNLAGLYHGSPRARHAALIVDLAAFMEKYGSGPLAGSRRAVGAMLIAVVLANPSKWPSLPLPETLAPDGAEQALAVHLKMRVGKAWTIAEDRALREATAAFHRKNTKQVLASGKVILPNRLTFYLAADADAACRPRRDAWVARQFAKARK